MKKEIPTQMSKLKFLQIAVVMLAIMVIVSGCGNDNKISEECRKAYEDNKQAYDYTGDTPEECRK